MSLESLMTDTVEILTPVITVDNRGNQVRNWDAATSFQTKAWITQRGAIELTDHREGSSSDWICFLKKEVSIDSLKRIRYNNGAEVLVFKVLGRPQDAKTPQGKHHWEVDLELVEG